MTIKVFDMAERLGDPRCWYCGHPLAKRSDMIELEDGYFTEPPGKRSPQREHQIPRSRGGKGGKNIVLDCGECNQAKRTKTVEEYREHLASKTGQPVSFFGEIA